MRWGIVNKLDRSHHPPVTAYAIINDKHRVMLEGYNGQKASFARGTISVRQVGHAKYHLNEFNEDCKYIRCIPASWSLLDGTD